MAENPKPARDTTNKLRASMDNLIQLYLIFTCTNSICNNASRTYYFQNTF